MAKQRPDYLLPLPQNLHPTKFRCVTFYIPDEVDWYMSFWGWLYEMGYGKRWQKNPAHDGVIVAALWQKIIEDARVNFINRLCQVQPGSAGADGGDENLIRQNPDNPCLLETSIDGVNWCAFADLSLCLPAPTQPGVGSEQPQPGGGCVTYHGVMGAAAPWYVPTVFNSGDTIEFLRADGVTNDGGNLAWRAPDGGLFFAGANTGVTTTVGSDPLPGVPHLKVIISIDGTFYDAYPGPFTIPGGISNGQMQIQVNDAPLANDSGTITFDLKVCNNQATTWSSIFDFTLSPYTGIVAPAFGTFNPGLGYDGVFASGTQQSTVVLDISGLVTTITQMTFFYNCAGAAGGSAAVQFSVNAALYGTPGTPIVGTNQNFNHIGTTAANALELAIGSGSDPGPVRVLRWVIQGLGAKPAGFP